MRFLVFWLIGIVYASTASALGPHEVVLLVNSNSESSVRIAEHYAKTRHIPAQNIVRLPLDKDYGTRTHSITSKAFTKEIWEPAHAIISKRGLDKHVLAR